MSITRLTTNGLNGTKYDTVSADNYYMEPIATTLVGVGGSTTITFSGIPQTYKHLQIRYSGFVSNDAWMRFNGDTGSNYARHSLYGNGASAAAYAGPNQTVIGFTYTASNTNPGAAICDILDYTNASKYKTARVLNGDDQNGSGIIMLASGLWMNTAPITSITIYDDNGSFSQYSRISLYGIKG